MSSASSSSSSSCMMSTDDKAKKWESNIWRVETMSKIVATSHDMVTLTSDEGNKLNQECGVHRDLLCHYSPYYRAATKSGFAEAGKTTFEVEMAHSTLMILVAWFYTGNLDKDSACCEGLLEIYTFADKTNVLALRRSVISCMREKLCLTSGPLPKLSIIQRAYEDLPPSSQYIKFQVDSHASHWEPEDDPPGYQRKVCSSAASTTSTFLYQVLRSKAKASAALLTEGVRPEHDGPCCTEPCKYHEHESEEERLATCGV